MLHILSLNTMDCTVQSHILTRGRATDQEHIKAYDLPSGRICVGGGQSRSAVAVPDDLLGMLLDPKAELYIHHNHPDGCGFSRADLVLALGRENRARGKLFAQGHDGSVYGVMIANRDHIDVLYRQAAHCAEHALKEAISGGGLPVSVARSHFAHIVSLALDLVGVMHYEFAMSESRLDGWLHYADHLSKVVMTAAAAVGR
ncbi:hypothetical protein [Azospirillum thermophilum]|uniref:Uncharacterized protein n=1 Tax=Azospirillum thermophilum TaxID=2202148 RepID=A0A2S2CT24_9PROT|nr:hypothetical protein [Azospirillum thermophilum]AWK87619.1 hypothetical protein DEW08_16595 [Azospirillum thermophilum]